MTGKSHLITATSSSAVIIDTLFLIEHTEAPTFFKDMSNNIQSCFLVQDDMPHWLFLCVSILFFMIGSLLPDIDHEGSSLGKRVHIPVKHRTWLHSIWFLLLFVGLGIFWNKVFLWMSAGVFYHLFWDSFSASKVYWLYPWKKKIGIRIYYTGQMSEYVTVGVWCTLVVGYTIFVMQMCFNFLGFIFG